MRYRDHGDLVALGRVFDVVAPQLLSLGLHLCGHAADAEDALQATFVVAMRKAGSFDPGQRLAPWLAGILTGEARNLRRRADRRRTAPLDDHAVTEGDPARSAERRDLVRTLRAHITSLPAEQRQALLLQLEYGLEPAQIAEVLGVPPGTVRMRLHRGLAALRRLLPAGLAAWAVGALAGRGMAAVRRAVLTEAKAIAATGGVGVGAFEIGGVLMMKQIWIAVAVLTLIVVGWFAVPPLAEERSTGTETSPVPAVVAQAPMAPSAPTTATAAPSSPPTDAGDRVAGDAPSGALRVRVRFEGSDEPVPAVEVSLLRDAPTRWSGTQRTDARGEARFARIPAGSLQISFWPSGETSVFPAPPAFVEVTAGGEGLYEHALPAAGVLTAKTVDEDGRIVADARILVTDAPDHVHADTRALHEVGRSDGDGSFRALVVRGARGVAAHAAGHAPSLTQVVDADFARLSPLTLVLPRACGAATGTVRDDTGAPVANATVTIRTVAWFNQRGRDGAELRPRPACGTTTDAAGRFHVPDLACGPHKLRVDAADMVRCDITIEIEAGRTTSRDIVLGRPATLICRVLDVAGAPVPSARVRLTGEEGRPPNERTTDAEGRCRFATIAPGGAEVGAVRLGIGRANRAIRPRAGEHLDLELRLEPEAGIRGRLVDAQGEPLAGWRVTAVDETWTMSDFRTRAAELHATTSADGAFEVQDLGPHTFRLEARAPAAATGFPGLVLGAQLETGLAPRTFVVGRTAMPTAKVTALVAGPDGRPAAGARAWIQPVGSPRGTGVAVGTDGALSIERLPPGRYRLAVEAPDLLAEPGEEFELAADEHRRLDTILLRAGARLVVHVVDAAGEPWPRKLPRAYFAPVQSDGSLGQLATFDAEGSVLRSRPLPSGRARILVKDDLLFAWPTDVELVAGRDAAVQLAVHVGVRGSLRFAFGRTTRTLQIRATLTDAAGRRLDAVTPKLPVGIDDDHPGAAARLALLPGTWTVAGEDDAGNRYAGEFRVEDGVVEATSDLIPRVR